ncbi:MAG TPA: TIGR03067 domain-containing protein [Verrucomicrobiae bacterium]|jgi:uncharacterized protein (TIGR03067 family)
MMTATNATIDSMKKLILIPIFAATIFVAGCSTPATPSQPAAPSESSAPAPTPAAKPAASALEGAWSGYEVTPNGHAAASLTFAGQNIDYHGAEADDWVKGTFTIDDSVSPKQLVCTVTDCANADTVGKKAYAIYKMEDGTLTVAGNGPGDATIPTGFDPPNGRQFVFKRRP